MKKHLAAFLLIIMLLFTITSGQSLNIEGYLEHFEVFYFSDFDFNNAANNPLFFSYSMYYDGGNESDTDMVSVTFQVVITVPSLQIEHQNLFTLETDPFPFPTTRRITVTSQDVDYDFNLLFDDGSPVFPPGLNKEIWVNSSLQTDLQQVLIQTGTLPAGTYEFALQASGQYGNAELSRTVTVSNPSSLELTTPGGALEDNIEIATSYPVFQWESPAFYWKPSGCPECGYWIRVAEYIAGQHSSIEEALNDEASLPYPDDGGYFKTMDHSGSLDEIVTEPTTFQYPLSGARVLEPGHTYVWQVKKTFPTTSGPETIDSDIFVFSITDQSSGGGGGESNPVVNTLSQILDPDMFDQFFTEGGELNGFTPTGVIYLNGDIITLTELTDIVNQVLNGEMNVQNVQIEE